MTSKVKHILLAFFTTGWLLGMAISSYAETPPVNIVVLSGDELTSTKRTFSGARKVIYREYPNAVFHRFIISNQSAKNLAILDSVKLVNPVMILSIGSSATKLACDNFTDIPIVFSSVKYPVLSGFVKSTVDPGKNVTGASIDIPLDIQFKKFQQIIPGLKKIGVMYTENTASLIPPAKVVAKELGLKLVAIEIQSEKQIPKALDSLSKTVQGIWSVADANLFRPKTTRFILLNTVKKKIPFMGFSKYVVESGALFALDFDYKAVGQQAGEIANKILGGAKPGNINVTTADLIWFHYNEKTSDHINIKIPDELAAVAKEVYR